MKATSHWPPRLVAGRSFGMLNGLSLLSVSRPWRNWIAHRSSELFSPFLGNPQKRQKTLQNKAFSHF
jgi:hypothetical protein